jgi:mercuric ion binding protein
MELNFRERPIGGAVLGLLLATASIVWTAPNAVAEFTGVKVKVDGLACPLCAYGLEKKLAQVKGVTEAKTDLTNGTVNLSMANGGGVNVRSLDKAVREAGFSMKDVTVTALGWLKEENGLLVWSVRDNSQKFLLFEDSAREEEVHSGKQPKLLTEAIESALRKVMAAHALLAVTGKVHDHANGPAGLLIEKYAVVE